MSLYLKIFNNQIYDFIASFQAFYFEVLDVFDNDDDIPGTLFFNAGEQNKRSDNFLGINRLKIFCAMLAKKTCLPDNVPNVIKIQAYTGLTNIRLAIR